MSCSTASSRFSSLICFGITLARKLSGSGWPLRYRPVSMPLAKGLQTITPIP